MTGILINRSQLARTMGKSLPTIDAWVARGCPYERCGRGLQFDSAKVVAWLMEREASAGAHPGATLYLGEQRARLAREQADHVAIKNQRTRAELLPAGDALASWDRATAHARAVLLALPATLTDELMSMARAGDQRGIQALLDDRIRGALQELANTVVESDEDDEAPAT